MLARSGSLSNAVVDSAPILARARWKFACRSHYWIRNNRVIPSYGMDDEEIAEVIELDRIDLEDFFAQLQQAPPSSGSQASAQKPQRWLARLFKRLRSWV